MKIGPGGPHVMGKHLQQSGLENIKLGGGGTDVVVGWSMWRGDGYWGLWPDAFPVDSGGHRHGVGLARDSSISSAGRERPKVPGSRRQNPEKCIQTQVG